MVDKIIISIIVVFAVVYVFRKLKAEARGEGGCGPNCSDDKKKSCGCTIDFSKFKGKND